MTGLARPIETGNGLVGDIIASSFKLHKSKGGIFLGTKNQAPSGAELYFKQEPMERNRFLALCWLAGTFLVGSGILKFFSMLV